MADVMASTNIDRPKIEVCRSALRSKDTGPSLRDPGRNKQQPLVCDIQSQTEVPGLTQDEPAHNLLPHSVFVGDFSSFHLPRSGKLRLARVATRFHSFSTGVQSRQIGLKDHVSPVFPNELGEAGDG